VASKATEMINVLINLGNRFIRNDVIFRRILSNSSWLLSASTATMGLGFLQGILVARTLGVEQYGILTLIVTYIGVVNQFVDSRVWETVIKFVVKFREDGDFVKSTATVKLCYSVDVVTGTLAFVLLVVTANLAANLFIKDTSLTNLIQLYALWVLIAIPVDTSMALLRVADRFDWLAYSDAGVALIRLVGVIVVILLGWGIKGLIIVYLLAKVVQSFVLIVLSYKIAPSLNLLPWNKASLASLHGEYKRIGYFLVGTNGNAFLKLLRDSDILLISYWLTPTQVGYYRLARSISGLMQFPIGPLYATSYPEFTRLWYQQKFHTLWRLIRKLTLSSTAVAVSALITIWLGGGILIRFTVGEEFLPALPVLKWLSIGIAIAVATNFGHPLLIAIGRVSNSVLALALGIICQLTLLVVLLPSMGVTAAGVSFVVFYLVWGVVVIVSIRTAWRSQTRLVTQSI